MTVGTSAISNLRRLHQCSGMSGRTPGWFSGNPDAVAALLQSVEPFGDRDAPPPSSSGWKDYASEKDFYAVSKSLSGYMESLGPDTNIAHKKSEGSEYLPAELSNLYIHYATRSAGDAGDAVVLLASDTAAGLLCAEALRSYLTNGSCKGGWQRDLISKIDHVEAEAVPGLNPNNKSAFVQTGLASFAEMVRGYVEDPAYSRWNIALNLTGGFKGVIPYTTLLSGLFRDNAPSLQYLFEHSSEIITIPALPVYFDLDAWRDNRGILRAIGDGGPNKLGLRAALPPQLQSAFSPDDCRPTPLCTWMRQAYDDRNEAEGTIYGKGEILSQYLGPYRERYLQYIARWQYGWVGDQVPEMAEHQRGHSQRVLEFAAEILVPILTEDPAFVTPLELYILLCSVWLHDIGHSLPSFRMRPEDPEYHVAGFPTLIREYHHFLAAWMLESEAVAAASDREGLFFGRTLDARENPDMIRAVAAVARYHRQSTPIAELGTDYPAWKKERGLWSAQDVAIPADRGPVPLDTPCPVTASIAGETVRLRFLAALYRVLDASDVQHERIGPPAVIAQRKAAIRMETDVLLRRMHALGGEICGHPEAVRCWHDLSDWSGGLEPCQDAVSAFAAGKEPAGRQDVVRWAGDAARQLMVLRAKGESRPGLAVYSEWLSAANSAVFKNLQPAHYRKHDEVAYIVHEYQESAKASGKTIYRFRSTAGVDSPDRVPAALEALNEIKGEYWGVKWLMDCIELPGGGTAGIEFSNLEDHQPVGSDSVRVESKGEAS